MAELADVITKLEKRRAEYVESIEKEYSTYKMGRVNELDMILVELRRIWGH